MIGYIISIVIGILVGIVTGLIPGLHVNLLITLFGSFLFFVFTDTDPLLAAIFIISLSTTHIIINFIPSIYLGVPNSDTALNILPAHKMVKKGLGHHALVLNLVGCIFGLIFTILLLPLVFKVIPSLYNNLSLYIPYILILICILLIINNKNKFFWAVIIFISSGILGILALDVVSIKEPLLGLFSGLFGLSMLTISINSKNSIPNQEKSLIKINKKSLLKFSFIGSLFSSIFAFLPTISPSQIVIFVSSIFGKIKTKNQLILIGAINTAAFLISIITLYLFLKSRNAPIFFISQVISLNITQNILILLIISMVISCAIATIITIKISKYFSNIITRIDYKKITLIIILFILALVIVISGILGLIVLITGTAIGVLCQQKNINKSVLMASLILPTILYYLI